MRKGRREDKKIKK